MNFSQVELDLLEYATLSLSEEIDLFFCYHNNIDFFKDNYNNDTLKEKLMYIIDIIENTSENERSERAL